MPNANHYSVWRSDAPNEKVLVATLSHKLFHKDRGWPVSMHNWIYTMHEPEKEHLEKIKNEMKILGAPTIRVVDCGDHYMALEGSGRVAAAHELGIEPILNIFDEKDKINITNFDWFDAADWGSNNTRVPAYKVVDYIFCAFQAGSYDFDFDFDDQRFTIDETSM